MKVHKHTGNIWDRSQQERQEEEGKAIGLRRASFGGDEQRSDKHEYV